MKSLLDNSLNTMMGLWKEFFQFKKFKRFPLWAGIILGVLLSPFVFMGLLLTFMFGVSYFILYIVSVPTMALQEIIHEETKGNHFLPNFAIYLCCFPFVFFLYAVSALMFPSLFVSYLFVSVLAYVGSLGGVKFSPMLNKECDRSETITEPKVSMPFYLPYICATAGSHFIFTVLSVIAPLTGGGAGLIAVAIFFLVISYVSLAFGWAYFNETLIKKTSIKKEKTESTAKASK